MASSSKKFYQNARAPYRQEVTIVDLILVVNDHHTHWQIQLFIMVCNLLCDLGSHVSGVSGGGDVISAVVGVSGDVISAVVSNSESTRVRRENVRSVPTLVPYWDTRI